MSDTVVVFVTISFACGYRAIVAETWQGTWWMVMAGLASAGMAAATAIGVR